MSSLTSFQSLIIILMLMAGTQCTRFLPFLLFPSDRPTPSYINRLGKVLPFAVIGLLVVYCLKGVTFTEGSHGLPEIIAIMAIVGIHSWKKSTLLSIFTGTLIYMLMVQYIFI